MDMQAITDKYYELTNAICDVEVTIVMLRVFHTVLRVPSPTMGSGSVPSPAQVFQVTCWWMSWRVSLTSASGVESKRSGTC